MPAGTLVRKAATLLRAHTEDPLALTSCETAHTQATYTPSRTPHCTKTSQDQDAGCHGGERQASTV